MHLRILTRARALVVRVLCVLSGIFFGIQICYCDVVWSKYYRYENIRLTTAVYDQIQNVMDLVCWSKCHSDSTCHSVNYNPGTRECQLSTMNLTEVDTDREYTGQWVTYSKNKPNCKNYLVSGPNGVDGSQLTESDYRCNHMNCDPADGHSAKYARLNMTGLRTKGWLTTPLINGDYIQVDFLYARTISAIALQWHDNGVDYVTSFKVLTSMVCESFTTITDEDGNDKVFEGNSATEEFVVRDLPKVVQARCVRINPVTWNRALIGLRFDVLGC